MRTFRVLVAVAIATLVAPAARAERAEAAEAPEALLDKMTGR